jgi:tetratricopeptide (TPR) repeat protein
MLPFLKNAGIVVGSLLYAPVRVLSELWDWVGSAVSAPSEEDSDQPQQPTWLRLLLFPFRLLVGAAEMLGPLLRYPMRGLWADRERRKHLLWGTPSILLLIGCVWFLASQLVFRNDIESRYAKAFDEAESKREITKAKALSSRLLRDGVQASPESSFRYCKLLATENELERANAILDELAPNDAPGYPAAHAQRATAYANLVSRGAGPPYRNLLFWHLSQAGNRNSEAVALAWATYYQSINQTDECARALEPAARANPLHGFTLANLYLSKGDMVNAGRVLRSSRDAFQNMLGRDPLLKSARLQLAQAQLRLEQFDEADQTVEDGLELFPGDPEFRRAKGALELARFERESRTNATEEKRFDQLMKILDNVDDPTVVFDRMIQLYNASGSRENRQRIREVLEEQSRKNDQLAILQFALSVVAILEERKDDAIALLDRTLEMDPQLHLAKNNLAWLLAEREPPDLDRALALAQEAVEAAPRVANYRDTLGTILLLRGQLEQAVTELERALPGMPEKSRPKIQQKLADAADRLGDHELAERYRASSQAPKK